MKRQDYVALYVKVPSYHKDLLQRFADEDKRTLTTEFQYLMEQEAARRLKEFRVSES